MEDSRAARESGAALALCLMAMGALWLHTHHVPRVPVDDAGISVAYARSVAEGAGFRLTRESAVAEGFSNPSWTLILVVLEVLGFDSLTFVKPLGIAFAAFSFPLLMMWGPLLERRKLQIEDALGPLFAAAHPSFAHWAQGGLEMGLQVFSIALLGVFALGPQTRTRALMLGGAAALVVLTRPEGALYAAAVGLGWLLRMVAERRRPGAIDAWALLTAALPVLAYLTFRRLYFQEWVPNTYFAKQHWEFLNYTQYVQGYWDTYRPLLVATLWAAPFAFAGGLRTTTRGLVCAALLGAFVYFTYHAHGDWMMEWRFLAVLVPFLGAAMGAGISGAREGLLRASASFDRVQAHAPRLVALATVLLASLAIYKLMPPILARSEHVRVAGYDVPIDIARGARFELGDRYLAPFKMPHPFVLASDMGIIALGMRNADLWDFAGLTDPAISHYFKRMSGWEDYMRNEGPPTLVLAWGPGNFFSGTQVRHELYDEVGAGHFLLKGLTPENDPRCPDGKAATLALSAPALIAKMNRDMKAAEPRRALARWRCAHTYRKNRELPTLSARSRLARAAEQLAVDARAEGKQELALRYYSLCAVVAIKNTRLTVGCRKAAESLRATLFPK